jgi:hypothetical protein
MSASLIRATAVAPLVALAVACGAGTTASTAGPAPADSTAAASALAGDTTTASAPADSAAARLARHVGFRQAIGDATRLGIVTGYSEVRPGRVALMLGPGFSTASTVEYHLKRIYSAYGDYLNHTLAPVLELHAGSELVGDYTWDGLALTQKVGQGS